MSSMFKKTIVIGLDAATWKRIIPLVQADRLPNLKRLMDEGASGTLRSTIPPMTPPAWTTMVTGVNPGKHGVYDFVAQDRDTYRVGPVNSSTVHCPAIWDLLAGSGIRSGVINFPLAFPPAERASFFISGLGAPEDRVFAHPPELYAHLRDIGYRIHPRFGPQNGADRYFDEVLDLTDRQCAVALDLIARQDWDLVWIVFQGLDWIQHYLWKATVRGQDAVSAFYCYLDDILGRLLRATSPDWNVILLSDHGFREVEAEIHLNNLLEQWGYLHRAENPKTLVERCRDWVFELGWRSFKALPFSFRQRIKQYLPYSMQTAFLDLYKGQAELHKMIDWERTKAFSYGYMGRIYIHSQGQYTKGCVAPGPMYQTLCREISEQLEALRDPETGQPIVDQIWRRDQLYRGTRISNAPDIIFLTSDMAYMAYGDFGRDWYQRPQDRVADHDMNGIVIIRGEHVRPQTEIDIDAADVTPTLLHLYGVPVPTYMDGRVICEVFDKEWLDSHPIRSTEDVQYSDKVEYVYDRDERQEIEQRLSDLGYL